MARNKKLVDLIYLDSPLPESQLTQEYQSRLGFWFDWLQNRQEEDLRTFDSYVEEQAEYYMIDNCLKNFLGRRLNWILKSVPNPDLRYRYLLVLPPFSQNGNIKRFLLHFFQVRDDPQRQQLTFGFLNRSERELRILWDMYKLTRTLQTIETLKKSVKGSLLFPSQFSETHVQNILDNLGDCLNLLFRICIKSRLHESMLSSFPADLFAPEAVLQRREREDYLVNDGILETLDYRNYLFYIYFRPAIKAVYLGEERSFQINYLDFEIMRQEFLIHWLNQRLKNNSAKTAILERYRLGQKTFAQIVAKRPEMEITLLKQMPKPVFDDLIAQVNEAVEPELKSTVDPMSETWGDFAKRLVHFEKAKELAQKSIQTIRAAIGLDRKPEKTIEKPGQIVSTPPPVAVESPPQYRIVPLREGEISFAFFSPNNAHFLRLHSLFKMKLETKRFNEFNRQVETLLTKIPGEQLFKRHTPRHEKAIPLLLEAVSGSGNNQHLLILGAELKNKTAGIGYSADSLSRYDYRSYFVYGTSEKQSELGFIAEERKVRGVPYYIYDFSHPKAIRQALSLVEIVLRKYAAQ